MALSNTQKGILSALCGFTAFAFADACSKWLGDSYNLWTILFWVYYYTMIFSIVFSPMLGGLRSTFKTKKLRFHIGRGISALFVGIFVVTALSNGLPLASMYTILFLAPFMISIAAIPLYKEKVPLKSWVIIAIGFSGILIAFHEGLNSFTPEVIYAFCALLFIVILSLLARPLNEGESLLSLSLYPAMTITLIVSIYAFPSITLPSGFDMLIFMADGLFVTIGLSGVAHSFRTTTYAKVAPVHYTQMVIALAVGYWVFDDKPDIWMLAGAGIIIISGIMLVTNKKH